MTTKTAPRDLQSYKFLYLVNLHLQDGQDTPTFTPVPREVPSNRFPRIAGERMTKMALYYTDEPITEATLGTATEAILRGGPNVVRPDADDSAQQELFRSRQIMNDNDFARAMAAADELKAVMAADGQFKFSLL